VAENNALDLSSRDGFNPLDSGVKDFGNTRNNRFGCFFHRD
jgi:hypothetical protein